MTRNTTPKQATHGILYEGPSMIDGAPIVVLAVYRTKGANAKTGAMVQTYIMRSDLSPMEAIRSRADESVCGDCIHRGAGGEYGTRSCYVNIGQGPRAAWDAYSRGRYVAGDPVELGRGRMVRIGTYGDPAAVPVAVWSALVSQATGHTGYTHQWRKPVAAPLRGLVMASCDTERDAADAHADAWRTFRVRLDSEPKLAREFVCPASAEGGKRVLCDTCLSCAGADGRKGSPVIIAHGALAKRFPINRVL
jgi:hypothetical protein